jgi:allene oxide cyclase
MRRRLVLATAAAGALAAGGGAYAASGGGPELTHPTRVHVIEHAMSDTVTDTGATGDTPGDLLTFHNPVFDRSNMHRVGRDQGDCIRIVSGASGSWECRWTTFLRGGSITVEGPFYDTHSSRVAVTGGTGRYRNARGDMLLVARPGGTAFDFIFRLEP